MYINKLRTKNFKCFEDNEISFNKRFNLIVGNNGLGKTSILEAVAIGISAYLNQIKTLSPSDKRNISKDDVRIKRNTGISEIEEYAPMFPVELSYEVEINNEEVKYTRIKKSKSSHTTNDNSTEIKEKSNIADEILQEGKREILPAFAFHGTGRVWAKASDSKKNFTNRVFGYQNCINPMSNEKQYRKWIKEMRRYEIDEGVESVELKTLYRAAERFLGKGSSIAYKSKEQQIIITLTDGQKMPYSQMSDGYKNALGIVFDTAFRMIKLNPWLKEKAIDETPGIILIDELDLHLHPSWQKRIINDFKKTFPKMQIIATTHAPIIVSSCDKRELIILESKLDDNYQNKIKIRREDNSIKGWLAENILEEVMGVSSSRERGTEKSINIVESLYVKKFQEGLNEDEQKKLDCLIEALNSRLPAEDPILTIIGLEALENNLKESD